MTTRLLTSSHLLVRTYPRGDQAKEFWMTTKRNVPMVFRISAGLLIIAAIAGQYWQRQPAGAGTDAVLILVSGWCSDQRAEGKAHTAADGARALDRCVYLSIRQRLANADAGKRLIGERSDR